MSEIYLLHNGSLLCQPPSIKLIEKTFYGVVPSNCTKNMRQMFSYSKDDDKGKVQTIKYSTFRGLKNSHNESITLMPLFNSKTQHVCVHYSKYGLTNKMMQSGGIVYEVYKNSTVNRERKTLEQLTIQKKCLPSSWDRSCNGTLLNKHHGQRKRSTSTA